MIHEEDRFIEPDRLLGVGLEMPRHLVDGPAMVIGVQRAEAVVMAVVVVDETLEGFSASWLTVGDCDVVIANFVANDIEWLTDHAYRKGPRTEAVPAHREVTRQGQGFIADGQALVATTDGMAELLDGGGAHALWQALAAAHKRESAVVDLLTALDARQHGNYDDRSLIAIGPIGRR